MFQHIPDHVARVPSAQAVAVVSGLLRPDAEALGLAGLCSKRGNRAGKTPGKGHGWRLRFLYYPAACGKPRRRASSASKGMQDVRSEVFRRGSVETS